MHKMYKSRRDKVIDGVCGGIAQYYKIDPVLVRIVWVLVTIFTAFTFGVIAYIIAMIIIPTEPKNKQVIIDADSKAEPFDTDWSEGDAHQTESAFSGDYTEEQYKEQKNPPEQKKRTMLYIAYAFIIIGVLLLLDRTLDFNIRVYLNTFSGYVWPLLLVALGVFLLTRRNK